MRRGLGGACGDVVDERLDGAWVAVHILTHWTLLVR
jgi:hypothetical protein